MSTSLAPRSASQLTQEQVVADLASRFLNQPDSELAQPGRLFFWLEQAQWFWEDHFRQGLQMHYLPEYDLREFCGFFFRSWPPLQRYRDAFNQHFKHHWDYLKKISRCGGILLDSSLRRCILVRTFNTTSWNFPMGKINQGEDNVACGAREVLEEVGIDILSRIRPKNSITATKSGRQTKLFVVPGISQDVTLRTDTVNEIGEIGWFEIASLRAECFTDHPTFGNAKFRNLKPFLGKLRQWIQDNQHRATSSSSSSSQSPSKLKKKKKGKQSKSTSSNSHNVVYDSGGGLGAGGWSAEDMFRTNEQMFGCQDTTPVDELLARNMHSHHHHHAHSPSHKKSHQKRKQSSSPLRVKHSHSSSQQPQPQQHSQNRRSRRQSENDSSQSVGNLGLGGGGWSVEDMFRTNEQLFGCKDTTPVDELLQERRQLLAQTAHQHHHHHHSNSHNHRKQPSRRSSENEFVSQQQQSSQSQSSQSSSQFGNGVGSSSSALSSSGVRWSAADLIRAVSESAGLAKHPPLPSTQPPQQSKPRKSPATRNKKAVSKVADDDAISSMSKFQFDTNKIMDCLADCLG